MLINTFFATFIFCSILSFPTKSSDIKANPLTHKTDNNLRSQSHTAKNKIPFTFILLDNVNSSSTDIEMSTEKIIFQMISKQLPEYNITIKHTDYDSAFNKITSSKNICLRNLMQTSEREAFFEFSRPINLYLGFRLYFSPLIDTNRIDKIKHLSISEMIKKDKKLTLGIEAGRAYGEKLSKIIKELPYHNKFLRHESDGENLMIAMLLKGRFDMLIESPEAIDYKIKKLAPNTLLQSMPPINADPVIYGRLACSKSPEARKLLDKINLILEKIYPSKAFVNAHLKLMEQPSHKIFKEMYENFIFHNVQ